VQHGEQDQGDRVVEVEGAGQLGGVEDVLRLAEIASR
jgi:hypothetical protein